MVDLPMTMGVLPGEAELLATHLADWLAMVVACNYGDPNMGWTPIFCQAKPDAPADGCGT